jgi:Domain of unknown function (DUF4249)
MFSNFRHIKSLVVSLSLLIVISCLDPYESPVEEELTSILVVDGFLNGTKGEAIVKLSRATKLSDKTAFPAELNAAVTIENEEGKSFQLTERTKGVYEGAALTVTGNEKYRLSVITTDGSEYQSDYIELKQAPSLDSITWKPEPKGITLYVNAHDPTANTRYYQWVFTETWEYTAKYFSFFKLVNGKAILRNTEEYIYMCWATEPSTQILIGSTAQLSEDQVRDFPLTFIPKGSTKISRKYSILVQQRSLSEETYNYWQQLEKTTENLGGLFDPMPSRVTGNMRSIKNLAEPVVGFFGGGAVQEKRIFIDFYDLPDYLLYVPPTSCRQDTILAQDIRNYGNSTMLGEGFGTPNIIGYTTSTIECLDCRRAGGTLTKPTFWE